MMNPETKEFEQVEEKDLENKKEELTKQLSKFNEAAEELLEQPTEEVVDSYFFQVGQKIKLQGHEFFIRKITKKDLVLRPVNRKSHTDLVQGDK